MCIPNTMANSQRTPTNISKNSAIAKVRILLEQFFRHLKTFRGITNEMQFYFLSCVDDILIVSRCIHINFLIFTFMSKCFFQIFVAK